MSKSCVCCGSFLPDSHNHKTCSMCYGDIDYGTDGYYREYMERCQQEQAEQQQQEEEK